MFRRWLGFGLLILFVGATLVGAQALEQAVTTARFNLPRTVKLGDVTLQRGTYRARLVPKEEGVFVQLLKGNEVVGEDLAIEQPAKFSRRRPAVSVVKTWNQNFIKITIHYGKTYYLMYLPIV